MPSFWGEYLVVFGVSYRLVRLIIGLLILKKQRNSSPQIFDPVGSSVFTLTLAKPAARSAIAVKLAVARLPALRSTLTAQRRRGHAVLDGMFGNLPLPTDWIVLER